MPVVPTTRSAAPAKPKRKRDPIAMAMNHPLRQEIVNALANGPLSPVGFVRLKTAEYEKARAKARTRAKALVPEPPSLGVVSYHFRILHDAKLVALESTKARRGAVEHTYKLDGAAAKNMREQADRLSALAARIEGGKAA